MRAPVVTVPDALPVDIAEKIRHLFKNARYEPIDQSVPGRYASWSKQDLPTGPKEPFAARFGRCTALEHHTALQAVMPLVCEIAGQSFPGVKMRAYRLQPGDYFRAHTDDDIGDVSFIYYLSKGWEWDWGGLLMTVIDGVATPHLPRFNSLVVMDAKRRIPHFVTEVSKHAKEPRFMLAGFCR